MDKYKHNRIYNIKWIFFILLFLSIFLSSTHKVSAATRTWSGATSGSWSVATNWAEGIAPVTGDDLVFQNGASNLSNTNDLTPNTIFNSITFSGSGYTISGNSIILGPGLAGITDSVSSGGNTIALDIRLDITRDIVVSNSGETLTISGKIAGVGGINKEGSGKLVLSGANTFGGILKINVGIVNAQNSTALGTIAAGTEVVGNAALELEGGIDISYEALALRGYGVSSGGALRNISGSNTIRGLITLSSAGGTEIASDAGTLTITGGTTGNFPLVLDGAGDITFSTAPLAGSGAITKNGAGTVTLNFPNTNTGAIVINAGKILYGVDNALMTNAITVTGGTLDIASYSDMVGTVTLGTLDLASGTITGTTGVLSSATWTLYNGTVSAIIAGVAGVVTKSTSGTVFLTRANLYTGATTVSAGILEIQDSNALGVIDGATTVSAGATLQIDGNGLSIPEYITFSGTGHLYTGAIRNTTGNNTLNGLLTLGAAAMIESDIGTTLTIDAKGLSATTLGLTIGGAGNTTFTSTAPIYGTTATLTKNDSGTLSMQAYNNFTGATNINGGEVSLSGSGAFPQSTSITISAGSTLTLDNTTSTTPINRLSDAATITMNGGNFNFKGSNISSTDISETSGALTSGITNQSGQNTITITPGSGGRSVMRFASLTRTAGSSLLFRGTDFGKTPGANVSTLLFTSSPTLTGGGGAAGTKTISIIAGAFGDNSPTGTGTDMVTYNIGNTNGLRLLGGAGFIDEYGSDFSTANANVKLTQSTVATTSSINSFILSSNATITNPGTSQTITLASGNILNNTTNATIAGTNTTIAGGSVEIKIHDTLNLNISGLLTTTGGVTKSGPGITTIGVAQSYTGLTSVNSGTFLYGTTNALSSGNVTVNGGTFDVASYSDSVGAVILQNGTITGSTGILTGTSYSFREGTVSAIIAGTSVVVTRIATNTAADSVVILTRDNTYTGATTITSGILKLGGTGNGTNTPFGTSAGGITVANIAALDLNGYTLSTTEVLSVAGFGFGPGSTVANGNSNMGALMNSSASPVSYNGAIALTAAARINSDYGAITSTGAVSGAFGLTIGGFSDSTFSGVIGTGTGTITKDGIGVLTLSNSNTYTGATTISMGTLKLGASGGATNTPLGTTGGATTVSTGARLDLNGYTLGTAEALTLNGVGYGLGDFASGALINSSASTVSYSGLITLGSTGVLIKADSGNINITNTGTITGSGFSLTLGGLGIGTLTSIIGTVAGTLTKIDTGTWTLAAAASTFTGATSINRGTLKLGVAGGATNTPLGTTGSGTSIMSGASLDLAGYALGTAEALTINGRGIGNGGALVNSGGAVTFTGTIAQATDSRITNSGSGLLTLSGAVSGAFALYVDGSANTTFGIAIPTTGLSLTKQGSGTLTVTGTNLYTGETRVDAGTFAYAGTTTLAASNLLMKGGTFNSGANADTIGTVTLIGGTITNSAALTATAYTLEGGTISGILAGAVAVTKNTNNTVTLTGVNTISSTTTINAGTLTISGSGSATATTITVNLGGTLTLDNSSTAVASRLGDALALTMNGGNFNFIGNSASTSSETTGALTLSSGHSTITVTPGAGGSTTMTFASLSRTAGATALFRGTNLGSTPAASVSTLMFTSAPTLTGGGGAANSSTISVIKGAFGDNSLSGTGTDMVTYNIGNTNGLRRLNATGFSGEYATNFGTANANVKLTADTAATTASINSLILNGFSVTNPGSAATLTLASASLAGNILINSATNIAGANTTIGITTLELQILATANSTISAIIGTATTGLVTLSGSGTVTLSAANLYTGITYINNATLAYGASNALSSGGVTIVGGTYNLNGNSDTIGALSINAGNITTGAGTLTTSTGGVTTIANNNVATVVSGNLALGAAGTFNIGNGLMDNDAVVSAVISGATTLTKSTGAGVLYLSGSNTYTGATTISAGTIRLGASGGATNTPLGTTAGGTTVSGASSALDLNGYTLGTSEGLTLSGALATGALQNTSSNSATYSGLITLGAASTIISNYGDINITNTGTITGATFALTIGGAGNGTLSSIIGTTSGTLTKNGLGAWTLSGASTYTGLTTVSVGTLKLGASGGATNTPLGTTGSGTTITSGAILDLNGYTLGTAEAITINGTGIASIGAFINSSNNSISYTGAITLGAASRVANYGIGTTTLSGNISGNFALTFVAVGNFTQATNSIWSGTGTLVKEGSGTLILAGQNTMTGAMTVSTGVLKLGASGGATNTPLGTNAGGVTVALGAVLDLDIYSLGGASTYEILNLSGTGIKEGGALISSASGANNFGAMTVTANSLVKNNGSGTLTFGRTITAANSINLGIGGTGPTTISGVYGATATTATINKWDAGILTINAASITKGLVRINGGTLKYGILDALATPAITVAGGTLDLNGFNETNAGVVTVVDGSIVNTGVSATLTSTGTYVFEKGTVSAVLGSAVAVGISKTSAGKFILSGNNTFTSTSISVNAGYLNLQHSNALGASGTSLTTTILGGATLELENNITLPSTKLITANGTGVNNNGAVRNISGSNTIQANLTLGSTDASIVSDSGTITIPSVSGNTFDLIVGGSGDTSITGVVGTTTGGVTKYGSGILTLTGVNTYTGPTTLGLGTIVANSTSALGDGSATNTLIFEGGGLQAAGSITSGATRAFILSSNAIIDTNGNDISVAGTVGSVGGLTKNGAGTLTLGGTTTLGGSLTITAGTFVSPTSLTINGDFSNSGIFTHSNGTVTLVPTNSTLTTNIIGSSNTAFYNLTNNTPGSILQFKAGNTYTFENLLTLTGGDGNPISINSDTPSSQWLMTLSGTSSISYVKVKDSGCSSSNSVGASTTIYDYGNNGACWSFISATYSHGGSGNLESSAPPDDDQGGGGGGGSGGGGSTNAIATAVLSSNVVVDVIINAGGSGYTSTPTVLFCGGGGSGALGTAVLTNGVVSGVIVDNGGSGYTSAPSVVFNSNCPVSGGGGGGGGGGDLGFLYRRHNAFAFLETLNLYIFNKIYKSFLL